MFSKANRSGAGTSSPTSTTPSILAVDCRIKGDLRSEGTLQVDGHITGDIVGKVVVIGEKGCVVGAILAEKVRILGSVKGQIKASSVELAKTAHVTGDIDHDSLEIAAGAHVEGRFNRLGPDALTLALTAREEPVASLAQPQDDATALKALPAAG